MKGFVLADETANQKVRVAVKAVKPASQAPDAAFNKCVKYEVIVREMKAGEDLSLEGEPES